MAGEAPSAIRVIPESGPLHDADQRMKVIQQLNQQGSGYYYDASRGVYVPTGEQNGVTYAVSPSGQMVPRYTQQDTSPPASYAPASTASSGGRAAGAVSFDQLLSDVGRLDAAPPPPPAPVYNAPANPGRVVHAEENPAVRQAAENSAYASAKDRIGAQGRASMDALKDEFSSRGLQSSDMEGAAMARVVGGAQGEMGQVARDISAADLARMNAVSDQTYQGNIAQRTADQAFGENTSTVPYQGAITTRGQDITAANDAVTQRRASLQTLANLRSSGVLY